MVRKFLAFDLETLKEFPSGNWRDFKPLGISCAAMLPSDTGQIITWYGRTPAPGPAQQMSREEVISMVRGLQAMVNPGGYTLLTWNGLNFDFPILGDESGLVAECRELAANHVDMMFQVFCITGHYLALNTAATGMGLPGKAPGVTGKEAPRFWSEGRHDEVLEYLAQDVRTTADVAQSCQDRGSLLWTSRAGNRQEIDLTSGWLPVSQAVNLPEPDTSWMTNPATRNDFTNWLQD
jgi:hypothetical protein